jgi:hypothetical protein
MASPTISGTVADQPAAELVALDPFVNVMITDDITQAEFVTVTVTMSNPADGSFSDLGTGSYDAATGTYTATVSYADFTPTNLNSLAFTPAGGLAPVGQTEITGFNILVTDTAGGSATDSTTSVVATTGTFTELLSSLGDNPIGQVSAGLYMDSAGNLFDTTNEGGASNVGTVIEIPKASIGYASTPTVLANFNGVGDGGYPYAQLIEDSAGDLIGAAAGGGPDGDGTVFELAAIGGGFASTPTVLVSFNGTDGVEPFAGLVADAAGDLFGTTYYGGTGWTGGDNGDGTVFEILNTSTGYASTPTTLTSNYGSGGSLIIDAAGNLFGSSPSSGVFEIPFNNGTYAATPIILSFASSVGKLAIDHAGDLFGESSNGTVFEIANSSTGYPNLDSPLTILASGLGNVFGFAGLLIDAAGDLFGTTSAGPGANGPGKAFEIANTSTGYASTPDTLVGFPGQFGDGYTPYSGLIADANGNMFGTTQHGLTSPFSGTVYELSGAGFVTCFGSGTCIATPSGERAVEALATGDDVLTASGESRVIVWIGRRHVDCRAHPAPERVWPVRIRAGAFGEALPRRDLWLSPDHAVYSGDALIPIKHLIDGTTIAQTQMDEVDYYHIELVEHDILLAEGMPAESYLDTGDRFAFDNGGPAAVCAVHAAWRWETRARAPLIATGPRLREARRRIARAADR